jgi:hypothetical protein
MTLRSPDSSVPILIIQESGCQGTILLLDVEDVEAHDVLELGDELLLLLVDVELQLVLLLDVLLEVLIHELETEEQLVLLTELQL